MQNYDENINMNDELVDEIYDAHYFRLFKRLLQFIGLWPFDSGWKKVTMNIGVYLASSILLFPMVNGVRVWCNVDFSFCCEHVCTSIFILAVSTKYVLIFIFKNKLKMMFRIVAKNFIKLQHDPEEKIIILNYANLGKTRAFGYFVYMTFCATTFSQAPLVPIFLDIINPLNRSRKRLLPLRGEFIVDPHDYYWVIYAGFFWICFHCLFLMAGVDGIFTVVMHQNLGLISIIKHRLHLATKDASVKADNDYDILVSMIHLHRNCLALTNLIEIAFSLFFLLTNILTVVIISIAMVVFFDFVDNYDPKQAVNIFRIFFVLFGVLIHLFVYSWNCQLLLQQSEELFRSTYMNKWYNLSERSKTLLKIVMIRFIQPSVITAGGLTVMNFENYGAIIKTTLSYITVAISFK